MVVLLEHLQRKSEVRAGSGFVGVRDELSGVLSDDWGERPTAIAVRNDQPRELLACVGALISCGLRAEREVGELGPLVEEGFCAVLRADRIGPVLSEFPTTAPAACEPNVGHTRHCGAHVRARKCKQQGARGSSRRVNGGATGIVSRGALASQLSSTAASTPASLASSSCDRYRVQSSV